MVMTAGCASPAVRHDREAARLGLERNILQGAGFEHVYYTRHAKGGTALHVYFDGDGTPWLHGQWPAEDPTPREPLVLNLAAEDPDGVYLGRPCYLGARGAGHCGTELWTGARYGETVVRSMASALRRLIELRRPSELVLIGYSGGGALAMLVAERVPGVTAIVTIAANLDHAAWTRRHGYLPLTDSLDPALRPALPGTIRQVHLVGALDDNVPPAMVRSVAARWPGSLVVEMPGYDHRCCWAEHWPLLLRRALAAPLAGR